MLIKYNSFKLSSKEKIRRTEDRKIEDEEVTRILGRRGVRNYTHRGVHFFCTIMGRFRGTKIYPNQEDDGAESIIDTLSLTGFDGF